MSTDRARLAGVRERLTKLAGKLRMKARWDYKEAWDQANGDPLSIKHFPWARDHQAHADSLMSDVGAIDALLADHARLTEEVERKGERVNLKNERAAGWRDALSCIQYCQANWLQDCKTTAAKDALNDAVKMLVDELCSSEPSDWLNTEWKSAQYWMDRVEAAEAREQEVVRALEPFAEAWERLRDPLPQRPFTVPVDANACARAAAIVKGGV